jgi:hypothetical protein
MRTTGKRKARANEPMRIAPPVPFHRGMHENGRALGCVSDLRGNRTRPASRTAQRRAIDMRPDQRRRLIFQANLLRFRAFSEERADTCFKAGERLA